MQAYSITIKTGNQQVTTTISARNLNEAKKMAASRGHVLSVKKVGGGGRKKLSLNDRLVFLQRLSSMLAARVGTTEALDVIYQSFSGPVREVARILRDQISNGVSLSQAMEAAGPRYFPTSTVAIIKTGAQGGDMAYAIREAARFEKELAEVKKGSSKGLWSAFAGFAAGIITILGSTLYVAPEIMGSSFITAGGGADIGWVMTMSDIITWIAVVVTLIVGFLLFMAMVIRPFAPAAIDRAVLKIPFYRDMVLAKSNYMVFFGLAVLLKAGLQIEEAISLTIQTAPKGELRNDLERAREALIKGSLTPWPYSMRMLHATDKAALATAQDKTQIASTIYELSEQYQMLYRSRMEMFVPALQMFSALFLSLAGFVLFGVSIIPLMQSSSSILKML